MFKIALIKEACEQTIWIGDNKDTSSDLVRSSLQKTGPIGLLESFGSDFFIVKSNNSNAGQKIRFYQIPKNLFSKEDYKLIERTKIRINSSRLPLRCPNDFSHDAEKINRSKYDIVISLNFAVPISTNTVKTTVNLTFSPHPFSVRLKPSNTMPEPSQMWASIYT